MNGRTPYGSATAGRRVVRVGVAVAAVALPALLRCVSEYEPGAGPGGPGPATCIECHDYPGSARCITTRITVADTPRTICSDCHYGAVLRGRSTVEEVVIHHDVMLWTGGSWYPVTGSSHADGEVGLNLQQCTRCHSYPPSTLGVGLEGVRGHTFHCGVQGKQCYECHYSTVRSKQGRAIVTDSLELLQEYATLAGGDTVPAVNDSTHMDHRVQVSFRKRMQEAGTAAFATTYQFDQATRTCSRIPCHGLPGTPTYEQARWSD